METREPKILDIKWLGHSGFKISAGKTIYIDPLNINETEPADILLITHEHYDHCSINDIKKIANKDTIVVTTPDCQSKFAGIALKNITLVKPGNRLSINGTLIEVVPAYNIGKRFHPRENEWVGYILTVNGKRIYHAGDTDATPEMKSLANIDIALVPVSGTFVMSAEEAADAVNTFRPKLAIPMHYGSGVAGTRQDAERFKSLCKVEVRILGA